MKDLTKAEEQIMHILWGIKKGFVNDIMDNLPDPKPAYNTVSTIVRILEKKGFIDHHAYGKTHEYFPLVSKDKYTKSFMKGFVESYFSNSYQNMVSFFSKSEDMTTKEIEEIIKMLQEQVDFKKNS